MALRLSFSRHAGRKLEERQITEDMLMRVLQNPQARFYDTSSLAQVAIREVSQHALSVNLVVIFRRRDDLYHIVTAFPLKDLKSEVERKVKVGRWIAT